MAPRRLTRRRLLLAGAATAAAAAGTAVAVTQLRGTPPDPSSLTSYPSPTPTARSTPTAPPTTQSPPPSPQSSRGGLARLVSLRSFTFDTFDSQRSGDIAVLEILGRTHSRIVDWRDPAAALLGPALAESWEQPSETTLAFRLDPAAAWHPHTGFPARPVTAEDLVTHLERTLQLATAPGLPLAQRAWDYATIDRVSAPDPSTLIIETRRPDPFLLATLAGAFALIQRPEAVDAFAATWHELAPGTLAGSGSFRFEGYDGSGALQFTAAPTGHAVPHVDGLLVSPPSGDTEAFLRRDIDEFAARDRRHSESIRAAAEPDIVESSFFEDSPVITTLHVGSDPWRDPNLRLALSAALNRGRLSEALFGGRAAPAAHVAPAFEAFALTESELAAYPGYRFDPEADAREAVQRWEAAGGPALDEVTIDFPAIFDPRYAASSIITGLLAETLGASSFRAAVDSYPNIAARAAAGQYGNGNPAFWFGWGPPLASPDPSLTLLETYHSASATARSLEFADPALDNLLDSLAVQFDLDERRSLARQAAGSLLESAAGGVLPWLLQRSELFRWSPLSAPGKTPFWLQHGDRDITIADGNPSTSAGGPR